jgi:hypothetical protein
MMLRAARAATTCNGVLARWPTDGISLRDQQTYDRAGATATPAATADLQVRNIVFAETNAKLFQAPSAHTVRARSGSEQPDAQHGHRRLAVRGHPGGRRLAGEHQRVRLHPAAGSPIATAGLSTFTGAIATKAGTFVTGRPTPAGAAPGGPKWWQGWTSYARN